MAHHKQLREIGWRLDRAKTSRSPERRRVYRHVEETHLRRAQEELRGTVRVVPSLPFGLFGLNYYTARQAGIPFRGGPRDVEVAEEVPAGQRREVAAHERREAALVKRGEPYEVAHSEAGAETQGPLFARV